jgi:pyruvate/2-oxoglutarate/acetoin dehydrogenase E1 component/TPP-dependent pyruvate/acetoin dehydrogenase alpha subunit
MREAIRLAIAEEMRADARVVVFGEDVAIAGGVFKATAGLLEEFGAARVRDTPISETAILGAAVGAACRGLRPIAEMMFGEFFGVALDQIITEAAKMHYLSAGQVSVPLVVRASVGSGLGFGAQHSQTLESLFMNTPGLVVVSASGPKSAYGLLRAAIQNDNPVVFLEPRRLYGVREDFDPASVEIPALGVAEVKRQGSDVTVVALGQTVEIALAAASALDGRVDCEVIDLRTILPWDRAAVFESVARTGRLVVVEENPLTGGWGADVASAVSSESFGELRSRITRITCPDVPVPFSPNLERAYMPDANDVARVIDDLVLGGGRPAHRWTGWSAPELQGKRRSQAAARRELLSAETGRLERLYEIRLFEEKAAELFSTGAVAGAVHSCRGQEAIPVAIASVTRPTDTFCCTYRGHGYALALGLDPVSAFAEILGRSTGVVEGKGGSMHLAAFEVGLLPTFAIVGAGIPVAVGAAYAHSLAGEGVAVAVFGDGAMNIGAFHESLNLAALWKLPVVFVCENNLYGEYSALATTTLSTDLAARAAAYGIPSESVDGQDVDAVRKSAEAAIARARTRCGPSFLEVRTYRYQGHSLADPAKYRPAEEVAHWLQRDPLRLYERTLLDGGVLTADDIEALRAKIQQSIDDASGQALAAPEPVLSAMFDHVFVSRRDGDRV